MKQKLCLFLLSSTMLVGCIKETKTVSKETNPYDVPDCVRTNTCVNNSTGGTGGGSTGGSSGGIPDDPNWGNPYPDGIPSGSCSGLKGSPSDYNTIKATLTSSGKYGYYDPAKSETRNYVGTDPLLKTVEQATSLFTTDSVLKVRFKALPEPQSAGSGQTLCYGRESGATSPGYTKIKIWPIIIGINADNTKSSYTPYPDGLELDVNSCSPALDLAPYYNMHPDGVYITIDHVLVNTGKNTPYSPYGVPKTKCWSIQFEVARPGTKTFD